MTVHLSGNVIRPMFIRPMCYIMTHNGRHTSHASRQDGRSS
jgi:hypothetical protein